MKLSKAVQVQTQKVAIIGLPGSGKTTLAAALASKFKLHWIDVERGSVALFKLPAEAQANVDLIQLPDSASYPIAADTLANFFKLGKMNVCHAHGKHECAICKKTAPEAFDLLDTSLLDSHDIVVIDSGTQWSNSILAHVLKGKPTDYKPERDDWGALRKHTEFALSQMQAVKYNLVVIFHAQEAELESGAKKLVPTFGSANMSTEVAKAFDHMVYCDIRNRKHVAFSSSVALPNVMTKSRLDFEIEKLAVPSLIPVFDGSLLVHAAAQAHIKDHIKAVEIAAGITEFKANELGAVKAGVHEANLTPAQQALANLKNGVKK
jgi:hypothetical protein